MRPPVSKNDLGVPSRRPTGTSRLREMRDGVGSLCSYGRPERIKGELQIRVERKAELRF